MDCVEPLFKIAKPVIGPAFKFAVQHIVYILRYRKNVDGLNGSVKEFRLAKERVNHQRDEAEKNLYNIEGAVIEWFRKVDEFESKAAAFENDEGHTKTQFPWNRYRLAKQAEELAEDVKKLIDESPKFDEVAYRENVTSNDATLSNAGFVEFGSTKSTMEDIMAQLENSTVRMVGLYGPGGVGKSTLIKVIAKKARDQKLFNVVVKVEITANPDPQKIQEEIAYVLGLKLEAESENVRADCLRRRLMKEKENTLVILDDLWDKLDFSKLGIPHDDDVGGGGDDLRKMTSNDKKDPNRRVVKKEKLLGEYKGCKILLTSRYKKVLSDHMVNDDSIFTVRKLDDKDALMLFQKVARIPNDEMSNFKQEIVKKYCAGLPMAIVTVARALRDKSDSVWESTLDKLKNQELVEVQNSMELSVKMSYDHLETEELKSVFLLSAQMGHQPLIMDLVKYCFGLGILEGVNSLGEARERIRTSIQKLKDSTLMLDVSSSNHFSMHDMVRDAALSIAHKEQNVFTLRNGQFDGWPELERCTYISICNSDIVDELPNVLNCPQLQFFQIDSDDTSLKIPDSFFGGMQKLRVLILNGIHLQSLPSTIKSLSNLRMLCLERCTLDRNLSIIGELKKLRILSFSGSQIKNLPAELGYKLQSLDISNCSIVEMIQPNLISRLTCLEELYIRKSLFDKLAKGETSQSQISFLSELTHLHPLKVVDLSVPCAAVLPNDLFFDKLNDYKIVIGDFRTFSFGDFRMPNTYEESRSLALQLKDDNDNIQSQNMIKFLFKRVENLLLGELNGVENVIDELNLGGFPYLKHLSISDNSHIKYIIKKVDFSHPQEVFPNLESLCLNKLRNMEKIHCSPVTYASFSNLKSIKVKMCAQLKNLFSIHFSESNSLKEILEIPVSCLSNLEIIDISESYSLKEIVEVEIPVNCDKVQFLKLHSLTLHLLPSLSSFYTRGKMPSVPQSAEAQTSKNDHIDVEDKTTLFGKLVEIPNLESLNLSSINIHKIWSDKPLSSFCFKNLIKLVVKDCNELRYLCSLSVANGLNKLKGLFISECRMMEKLFNSEGNSADKVFVFPKLEEIHLSQMNVLTEIWQPEVNADSFSSLISVHIERCEKLDKIFPSHMERWFASLDSLKVVDCKSVEMIFEIDDSQQIDAFGGIDTNLQDILLEDLPNLKHVWSTYPGGILNFKKLQVLEVYYCHKLCNVFPASVAKDVEKLEFLSVVKCEELVEIVACEDGSEANNEPLVFHELTSMMLGNLPNIKHFYNGRHPIECPKLKKLTVGYCEKLKTFQIPTSEITNEEEKAVFSAEKIIPNLEHLQIDSDQLQKLLLSNTVKYQMHSLEEFGLFSINNSEHLGQFFYRVPNLEKFEMWNFEESSVPCLGTLLQLNELTLHSSDIEDLGFEREPVLQRLELLSLDDCDNLLKLAPPSISLTYLTYLEVQSCNGLKNLMASSTAKSLVQLETMKVIDCDGIEEMVTNEGNEVEDIEIVFCKLITVELVGLKCLTSFCSDKSCKFKFPSLEILIVRGCHMMKTFSESPASAPKLQNILAVEGEEDAKWQWEGDLNATLQKVFNDKVSFAYTEHLNFSSHSDILESLWHHKVLVQENSFRNVKRLSAYSCDSLEHVIPSHLLPFFENLEELEVRDCNNAQVIFNINNENRVTKASGITRLKKVILDSLPKLEHVWDKDPEGIIGLQVLQDMSVEDCDCLKSLFPASVAKDLARLEVLKVKRCKELEEIFSEEEEAKEGETKMLVFRCLTSLMLVELPKLKYLYRRLHTLELPVLQELHAIRCELVTLKFQENHPQEQALIQIDQKGIQIPSFKKLSFCIGYTEVTWDPESGQLQFQRLERFEEGSHSGPLYRFLDMLPTIEKLVFEECRFEELFSAERPNADYNRILLHLKGLHVTYCNHLIKLIPGTMSFSNLTHLEVSSCQRLLYLFTSSTVKSLARLKRMEIKKCKSLKEIVSTEGEIVSTGGDDESREDEQIILGQLQVLYLEELGELNCFYPGNCTLCFPCLEKVYVIDCRSMKTFSPVNKIDHSTNWFSTEDATPQQECDLNSAARRTFWEMPPKLRLGDSPLQEIWHDHSLSIPDSCFSNLHSLIVDGCEFSDVLPFNLLPFLSKLETLKVRNCGSVKTIFDVKYITQDRIMTTTGPSVFPLPFLLKKLILEELPNLENVWNEDPCGILSMQLLQQVRVGNCECLISVFPTSIAKDLVKLENLFVQGCEELVAIVTEDNPHPREANLDLTFPCMTSLTLCDLPKLKYFYNCSLQCDMLKTSTHLESQTENQVWIKIIPNLEHLQIDSDQLQKWLLSNTVKYQMHSLKKLGLLSVNNSEHLGQFFYRVPNLEKFEMWYFEKSSLPCLGTLLQLKELTLHSSDIEDLGFERQPVLQRLELLSLDDCDNLIKLAPPSISLTYLTYLEVQSCNGLKNLMASSTAKSLVQLKTMKVIDCDGIEEMVTNEGNEVEDIEIVFCKLITVELVGLKCLTSFCSDKCCKFKFPSLEILIVRGCHMMKTFSESPASAPKLQNILAVEGEEDAKWQWEGDLNATLQKVFNDKVSFAYTEHLNLSSLSDILESLWHHKVLVQENSFRNLKRLSAYNCDSLEHIIPSHLLPSFENLEELEVRYCDKAQVIFNINDEILRGTKASGIIRLKKVILDGLPKLEHVWDKDPEGIIGLQVLQDMRVENCDCLKSLFPASVAKDLARLEVLEVKSCKELEEIFSEDKEGEEGETKMFVFSCLTSLTLEKLPGLKYLYPRLHTLELPVLQQLHAIRCEVVTLKFQENHPQEQALIQIDQEVIQIPSFKKLSFGIGDTKVTWDRESGQLQFDSLRRFQEESDTAPLYRFLDMLPTIEKLVFEWCSIEELFSAERPNADYNRILLHLKGLHVTYCNHLKKLIPGTVPFSNLTHLEVSCCSRLLYLFTSSTAKSLARLKRMEIKKCRSLKEIVSTEGEIVSTGGDDESREDEQIIFGQLQVLHLEELGKLNSFYPGNCTLCFPCLEEVYVIDCRWMKTFSPVNKIDHSTKWFSTEDATPHQECDLNSAARRTFWETAGSVSDLSLRDSPLEDIWHHHSLSIPDSGFSNLHLLIVDGCEFSDVLPFSLLPFLSKLETLEVRNCDSVKTIFDVKYITQDKIVTTTGPTVFPLPFLLKKLILEELPNLENVWNEDPCRILTMQLLQEVSVDNCKCLTSVFPTSVAKDLVTLENLVVQGCEELVAIVTEDNAHPREANLDLTFPCMTSLTLCDLPKLKYFYNCSLQCDMLKTSTHLESQTENQVWIKLSPNLQHLTLGVNELKVFWRGDFQGNLLHKLKVNLTLQNFHVESSDVFPGVFLQQVPNIENSWTEPFIKSLETLDVTLCSSSKNLVSCAVSFSNLTCLKVYSCDSLLYLFPSSTAKSLAQLKTMEIRSCDSIEEIVSKEGDESHEDEIIFQQLKCLKLIYLENLRSFYKGNSNFPSMNQLSVVKCEKMKTLCSGAVKADKLFELTLDWDDIELENDLNSTMREAFLGKTARSISNLKLRDSPDLQEIWQGSLPIPDWCFCNLECLIVDGCQFLSDVVLPFNLLPFFTNLETLEVGNCDYVKTIFDVKCIKQDTMITSPLKKLTLSKLPNLENIWNEDPHGILSMQLLEQVYVDNCKCLTSVFPTSVAKDLVNLEDLVVQHCEGMMVIVAEDNADQRGTIVELTFPCMTSLTLWDLPKLEYQVCIEKLTPNLENLILGEHELKMIWHGEFQGNLQHKFKVLTLTNLHIYSSNVFAYVFQQQVLNIEKLEVSCSFEEIFCFQSPNVEDTGLLSQLTFELSSFSSLRNLTPFPACFLNLTCLFVFECHRLENLFTSSTAKSLTRLKIMEIKCCESIKEIVSDGSHEDEIIFGQLIYLNLESLPNLTSFYRGSLSFPSLVQLSVINCHNMENLCAGTMNADKLLEVKFQNNSEAIPLQIDLNSTIWKTFLAKILESARSVSYLELRDKPNLQKIWHGSVTIPDLCFSNLHSLIVDRCQFLTNVLPLYLLPFLTKLETLEVRNCDSVKTIFYLKCITQDRKITFPLKKLILSELPNLQNVWNEDPYEILTMQLLQQVFVDNCKCLTSVFPTSVPKDLVKLERLVVQHCEGLMAIVAEDNADPKGTNLDLTFPSMVSMTLWDLPKFKKVAHVEPHTEDQVCIGKLTPNLEHLTLGENELKVIWHEEFQGNLLHKLKVLILLNCNESSSVFAHGCVQQVPNKDKLEGSSYSFKVISCYESPNVDHTEPQSQLKVLTLESLPEPFVRNLEFLELSSSSCLTNLAPFHICFPNLMGLFVSECHQLENLFTSSIAKSLARIKIMEIKSCESIKEIVSDGSQEDEIIFGQLLYLNLESLPNLTSFYKGSLSFPSLVQLSIINCHNMENICAGTINADKLLQVKFQNNSDAIPLEIDINSTIRKTLHATAFDYLSSSSSDTNEDTEYGED